MAQEVTEKSHAVLGPSGAATWVACPGSVVLQDGLPNDSSVHSRWGTVAHEVAALCLWDEIMEEPYAEPLEAEGFVGRVFSVEGHDIEVDMEMADTVNTYCSYVHSYGDLKAGDKLFVEVSVPLHNLTHEEGATGTSDAIWHRADGEIVVIDLKGGAGVGVDATENLQLGMYGLGAVDFLGVNPARVRGVIVQPRKNNISEFVWEPEDLIDMLERLRYAAKDVSKARAVPEGGTLENFLSPGEKQCRWCRAKATCPALRGEVIDVITASAAQPEDFANLDDLPKVLAAEVSTPADLDAVALAASMRAATLIENWLKAVRAEVERRLFAGDKIPGFKVVQGRQGNRAWSNPDEAEALLKAARIKADVMYKSSLISPTEAEKILAKDKPKVWKKVEALITRSEGSPSVAPESDPRPAYSTAAEPEDFADLTEGPAPENVAPAGDGKPSLLERQKALFDAANDPLLA